MGDQVLNAVIAGAVSVFVALLTSIVTLLVAERKLRRDFRLEFSAEAAVRALLQHREWTLRSFEVIKRHVGGFSDDALRQVLVRAGAIRFTSKGGDERWGLLERNRHRFRVEWIEEDPSFRDAAR